MAENTIEIKFSDDDGGRGGQEAPAPGRSGVEPTAHAAAADLARGTEAEPLSVELTRENADLLARYLEGKSTADELVDKLKAGGTDPQWEAWGRQQELIRRGFPVASRIPTAGFTVPEGGEADIQAELFDQLKRQEERDKRESDRAAREAERAQARADRDAAQSDREAKAQQAAADRQTDELIDGFGRLFGIGNVSGVLRTLGGGAAEAEGAGVAGRAAAGIGARAAGLAAGGPPLWAVGAALAIDAVADKVIAAPYELIRSGADKAAASLTDLANNDLGGMLRGAGEAFADFMSNTGIAGKFVAEYVRTVMGVTDAARGVVVALTERGRQLRGLESGLASAAASADVARLQADIREAQVTGPDLARLTQAQTELESLGREIVLILKSEVVTVLADVLQPVGEAARMVAPLVRTVGDAQRTARNLPRMAVKELVEALGLDELLARVRKILGIREKEQENALISELWDALNRLPVGTADPGGGRESPEQLAGQPTWFS